MTRKRIYLLMIAIVVVLLAIFFLFRQKTETVFSNSTVFTYPTAFAHYDADNLVFSNGRFFVKYNYRSGQVEKISKDEKLPDINQIVISESKQYFVFRAVSQRFDDTLGKTLISLGLSDNLSQPLWWMYDTKTQSFKLIGTGFIEPQWLGDSLYAVEANEDGRQIVRFQPNLKREVLGTLDNDVKTFYLVDKDRIVLELKNGDIMLQKIDGSDQKRIAKQSIGLAISSSKEWISVMNIIKKPDDKINLSVISLKNFKAKRVAKIAHEDNGFAWSQTGDFLYYSDYDERPRRFDARSGDKVVLDVRNTDKSKNSTTYDISNIVGENLIVGTDHDSFFHIIGAQDTKWLPDVDYFETARLNSDITIQYFPEDEAFIVTCQRDNSKMRKAVYDYLRTKSINPDLVKIHFSAIENTPTRSAPTPAQPSNSNRIRQFD